jgi:hypothetical protein
MTRNETGALRAISRMLWRTVRPRMNPKVAALALGVCWVIGGRNTIGSEVDVAFIEAALRAQFSSIQDLKASIHCEVTTPEGAFFYRQEMIWMKKGEMEYLEKLTTYPDGKQTKTFDAWNGKRGTTWIYEPLRPEHAGTGAIIPDVPGDISDRYAARIFMTFQGQLWPDFLATHPRDLVVEQRGGQPLYRIEGQTFLKDGVTPDLSWKVWVDPEYGFMPIRWEIGPPAREWLDVREVVEFQKVNGLFLPKRSVRRAWNGTIENITLEIEVNKGIPDSQFELQWTKGTGIYDHIRQKGYIVGEPEEPDEDQSSVSADSAIHTQSQPGASERGVSSVFVSSIGWCRRLIRWAGLITRITMSGCARR